MNRPYRLVAAAVAFCLFQGVALAATEIAPASADRPTAVPAADARPTAAPRPAELAAPAGTPARRIDLAPPSKSELADLVKPKSGPLPIGVARDLPAASRVILLRDLPWATTLYAMSTFHCMSVSLGQGGDGLGAVWGVQTAQRMLRDVGFSEVVQHELEEDPFNAYFVARP